MRNFINKKIILRAVVFFITMGIAISLPFIGYDTSFMLQKMYYCITWDSRLQIIWDVCIGIGLNHFFFASKNFPELKSGFFRTSSGLLNSMLNALTYAALINSSLTIGGELIRMKLTNQPLFANSNQIDYFTLLLTLLAAIIYSLLMIWKLIQDIFTYSKVDIQDITGTDENETKIS